VMARAHNEVSCFRYGSFKSNVSILVRRRQNA
jgi:hypothetical protein